VSGHALTGELRAEFEPLLRAVAELLTDRYGDRVLVRIAPSVHMWRRELVLEAFAPNTASAALTVGVEPDEVMLEFGNGIDCVLVERHPRDEGVLDWLITRISAAADAGIELWRDRRRHLFGGQNVARVAGEPFTEVSAKHLARLTLSETTEPWTAPGRYLDPDPIADPGATAYFIDGRLPDPLKAVARAVRTRFGAAISIVTRTDSINRPPVIEVLPEVEDAARIRIYAVDGENVGIGAGQHQYVEYEYHERAVDEAIAWLDDVGQHGLLETVEGSAIYYFVNHAATADAVRRAESDRKVTFWEVSRPWI
jgi:hypothetical protein